jgi:hypothetical protein
MLLTRFIRTTLDPSRSKCTFFLLMHQIPRIAVTILVHICIIQASRISRTATHAQHLPNINVHSLLLAAFHPERHRCI